MLFRSRLQGSGHVVREAASGEAALTMLAERGTDLVLMDVQMPGLDGLATARCIRAQEAAHPGTRRLRILAVTGDTSPEAEEACRAAGMDGCLAKPISRASLHAALQDLPSPPAVAPGGSTAWADAAKSPHPLLGE